jgi:hypothetical protein
MHARKRSHVLQLHHCALLPHHHVTDLQWPQHTLFQDAAGTHHMSRALVAFGYAQGNGLTGFLEVKSVVAHGQITNLQKPVTESTGLHLITHHSSLTHLKEAVTLALGGVIEWASQCHLNGIASGRMND